MRLRRSWRGVLLLAGLTVLLAGCAEEPSWLPWKKPAPKAETISIVSPPPPTERPKPKPPHHAAAKPKVPVEVALIDPATLVGMRREAVGALLGAPSATRKDEMSLIWTYAANGCVLKVYFYPDLKTANFHVLKYALANGDGKPLGENAPCRRKLLATRTQDAG